MNPSQELEKGDGGGKLFLEIHSNLLSKNMAICCLFLLLDLLDQI
jgi:hypothetical protein